MKVWHVPAVVQVASPVRRQRDPLTVYQHAPGERAGAGTKKYRPNDAGVHDYEGL